MISNNYPTILAIVKTFFLLADGDCQDARKRVDADCTALCIGLSERLSESVKADYEAAYKHCLTLSGVARHNHPANA